MIAIKKKYLLPLLYTVVLSFVFISCEKEVFTGPAEETLPANGKVFLQSNPAGAQIFLNGKNMGIKTPDTLSWLRTGNYVVTLKLGLFEDSNFVIKATEGQLLNLMIDYYLNPGNFGKIECTSKPTNAEIVFNGAQTGKQTPYTFTGLFPGTYKLKFAYPEHRTDSASVIVRGGRTTSYFAALDDTSKWVIFNIDNSILSSNHLSCVTIDKNNVKWIGTRDKGLIKFDGKKFTVYRQTTSPLLFDFINCLAVDSQNRLWVGTTGGLQVFNGTTWINYTSQLPSTYITSIVFDNVGNAWIGTQNGLVKYNGSSWQVFNTTNSGLPANFVTAVAVDNKNGVWAGTNAFGMGFYDGAKWTVHNMGNMKLTINAGNGIKDIQVDKNGLVFVSHAVDEKAGEAGGLSTYDGTKWNLITVKGVPSNQVESIYIDLNNYKWISTKNGIARFLDQPSQTIFFNTSNSLIPASQIIQAAVDQKGDLYVATFGGGLGKLKKGNF